ncbi:27760_t:CDS:2, partial [Gigaspora margarita]
NKSFQTMIKRLNNIAKIPSANTISNKIIKTFNYEQANLQKKLQEIPSKISLTLDTWTSRSQKSFIGITGHWISNEWKLQQCTIEFCHFEEEKYFNENLEFSSTNQRVYCLAHIINLAVQEILKTLYNNNFEENNEYEEYSDDNEEINTLGALGKLKKLVIKIRKSPQKRERLSRQCFILQIKKLELIDDVKTRWNSTYDMIERALNLQQALNDLVLTDKSLIKYSLTNNEWNKLEQIKKLLKCFKDATLEISASSYPTLSCTIPIYNYLLDLIENFLKEDSYSNDIINAINKAKLKLQKYYPTTNGLAYIISIKYFKDRDFDDETIEIYQQQIINLWKTKYMPIQSQNNNQTTNKSSGLMAYIIKKRKHNELDELIKYLKEPPSNCDIDILTFWKQEWLEIF